VIPQWRECIIGTSRVTAQGGLFTTCLQICASRVFFPTAPPKFRNLHHDCMRSKMRWDNQIRLERAVFNIYMMIYDIFNCNWVATRWQLFSTHVHTNTGNVTKQTIHRTQKIHTATTKKIGRVRAVPRLCGYHPGIFLTTEEKAQEKPQSG
jgi:hypothetical protein